MLIYNNYDSLVLSKYGKIWIKKPLFNHWKLWNQIQTQYTDHLTDSKIISTKADDKNEDHNGKLFKGWNNMRKNYALKRIIIILALRSDSKRNWDELRVEGFKSTVACYGLQKIICELWIFERKNKKTERKNENNTTQIRFYHTQPMH